MDKFRSTMIIPKPKKIKKSTSKKKAWNVFSKYIRHYYAKAGGYVECYTCGKEAPISEMQAGHGIGGRNNAVLFMEEVVRPQCVGCNLYGGGKYAIFIQKLIKEHGMRKFGKLVDISNTTVKYSPKDYEDIFNKYAELLKNL